MDAKSGVLIAAFLLAALLCLLDTTLAVPYEVNGIVESAGADGTGPQRASVRLDNGVTVLATASRAVPLLHGDEVRIFARPHLWGYTTYFVERRTSSQGSTPAGKP